MESGWGELYNEVKTGVKPALPADTYTVEVVSARAYAPSRMIFLAFTVVAGPLAGKPCEVSLYVPKNEDELVGATAEEANKARGARFHFGHKLRGFGDLTETFNQMGSAADFETALSILADNLVGRRTDAEIGVRSDGDYAGTNELKKTKPTDMAQAAPVAPAPAPQQTAPLPPPQVVQPAVAPAVPF